MNKMIEWALYYVSLGFKVFPLAPNTNIPLKGSNGHHDATNDEVQIIKWWTNHPDANIGVATGAASGIWVLDIDMKDGKNGHQELKSFLEVNNVPMTPVSTKRARTATGGTHVFFRYDADKPVTNRAGIFGRGSGVDVRGDGGYVCVAPSVRPEGGYQWAGDALDTPVSDAPEWAYTVYEHDPRSPTGKRSDRSSRVDPYKLPWDTVIGSRRLNLKLSDAQICQKYICRCPFHDDKSASAFFKRTEYGFGVLFCSACDTSWVTEKKRLSHDDAADLNGLLRQLKQKLKEAQ